MKKKIISAIPFFIVCLISVYTFFKFIFTEYVMMWMHYVAFTLVGVNAALYLKRYKQAVILTGVILILATFNLLSFFFEIRTAGFTIMGVSTPDIQLWSLLLLVIYCAINYHDLIEWYLDFKEERAAKKLRG